MAVFTNRATLIYNNESINSNTVVGEIPEALSITKSAVGDEYSSDNDVVYAVSLVNSGTTALAGVTLTDDLGAYTFGTDTLYPLEYNAESILYYVNGTPAPAPAVAAGPPLVISGITVPAGGNVTVVYSARVTETAPVAVGGVITNTIVASGTAVSDNVSAVETVAVAERASLTITKALSPQTVSGGGTVTYTLTLENTGNVPAADSVVVTDTFDPILTGINVIYNGNTWTAGTDYTYNEATGELATIPGSITVPAATYTQDPVSGVWTVTPGVSVITVTGTI